MRSRVFLMTFEMFHLVMKHCVECLILRLEQNDFRRRNQGCKNEQFFIWFPNTHWTLISSVFSLWIINQFEKGTVNSENKPPFEGLYDFGRGLSTEGNLCFKIDWASLMVGGKFTVFALFYLYLRAMFQVQALYLEGRFNGGFFALLAWGAYNWRGLFSEFYGKWTTYTVSSGKRKWQAFYFSKSTDSCFCFPNCKQWNRAIFEWPWKMVLVSVRFFLFLFYWRMDEKIKTWPLQFRAKENPNMEKALFHWPIVLQYDVIAKYRLNSRNFLGMKFFHPSVRLINQKPRAFVSIW